MNLIKLIQEKKKRMALQLAVDKAIKEINFTKSIKRGSVHKYVCALLGEKVHNLIINQIKRELIANKIIPTRSGNRLYYRHVDSCKNYDQLKFGYLRTQKEIGSDSLANQ